MMVTVRRYLHREGVSAASLQAFRNTDRGDPLVLMDWDMYKR